VLLTIVYKRQTLFSVGYESKFLKYDLLTHSTEQSPSLEANRFATSQEIPRILWNPKVHYRI